MTLQQKFDRASQNFTDGNCVQAIADYSTLEADTRIRPGSLSAAAISLRKGICLTRTQSSEEGQKAIAIGLAVLEKAGPEFEGDVALGWMAIGHAHYHDLNYAEATKAYKQAMGYLKGYNRLDALVALAKSTTFDGTPESLRYAQDALTLIQAQPAPDNMLLASVHTLHARTLLNQGKATEAYKVMQTALRLSGGLTTRSVKLTDIILRSDLAMAALQVGQKQFAQTYLAHTGIGRLEQSRFSRGSSTPPRCGSETGLTPEDVAVVELALSDDGRVKSSHTIFTRGGPQTATAFARAVRDWEWQPEDAVKFSPAFRASVRFELRCSTAPEDSSSALDLLENRLLEWARGPLSNFDGETR